MIRKALVLFTIVMLVSSVSAFACHHTAKTTSADKTSATGDYTCGSKDKAEKTAVKSAEANAEATVQTAAARTGTADCPYMKANQDGSYDCSAECKAKCTAAKDASLKSTAASAKDCASKCDGVKSASVKEAAVEKANSECSSATEKVKSASEETKEAVKIDNTVMTETKAKSEKA